MSELNVEPHVFVVLGGTGDLMARKLLPALHHLAGEGFIDKRTVIIGAARSRDYDDRSYREWARKALTDAGVEVGERSSGWCEECLFYQSIGKETPEDYAALAKRIQDLERDHRINGNRIFYLALPPNAFPGTIEHLSREGFNKGGGWTRVVIEKPFGRDLDSARALNEVIHRHFEESQIYRIDHYLGKETVQNLLVFRFGNAIFESIWNRDRVDNIQITVAESGGVEGRVGYYEQAGAIRDMVQNHLSQLLTLTAMEVPVAFEADAIRQEKAKILRSLNPIRPEDVVLGQYTRGTVDGKEREGYREHKGVAPGSTTETFVAIRLEVASWRWQGVPFYLRTGKRMPKRSTRIVINFRYPPVSLFHPFYSCPVRSNVLVITLQPDEGFDLSFEVKRPGEPIAAVTQHLDFAYKDVFAALPDAYQTLLLDVMIGDQTLFVRSDEVEQSWKLFSPLAEARLPVSEYATGTWGPAAAEALLNREGKRWHNP